MSEGFKGLKDAKRGIKSEDKKLLSSEEENSIQTMIIDKMPDQLKLSFSLWTRKAVKELIERELDVAIAIRTMGKRLSTNMISSITNQGKVEFMIYSGTMNADRFLKFLRQLIKNRERKIYLILDNLKVHHSKIVKKWVEKTKEQLSCFSFHLIVQKKIRMNILTAT